MEKGVEYLCLDRIKKTEFWLVKLFESRVPKCTHRDWSQRQQFSVRIIFIGDRKASKVDGNKKVKIVPSIRDDLKVVICARRDSILAFRYLIRNEEGQLYSVIIFYCSSG